MPAHQAVAAALGCEQDVLIAHLLDFGFWILDFRLEPNPI
jgi:hypothetical protein